MADLHMKETLDPTKVTLVEVAIEGSVSQTTGGNKRIVNVFHFSPIASFNYADFDAGDFNSNLKTGLFDHYKTGLHGDFTMTTITTRVLNNPLNPGFDSTFAVRGSTAGDRLSTDDSVVINFPTNARGRSFQGRKHFGPISETFTVGDRLSGTGATTWTTIRDFFRNRPLLTGIQDTDWNLVVLSQTLSDMGADSPVATWILVPADEAMLNLTVGTMRKRKEKTQVAPG